MVSSWGKIIGLGFGFTLYTLQRSDGLALSVLLGFYREFLRGHMAESSEALILPCLALVYIYKCIFGMRHSFQYMMVNVLSKPVVSLSYTRLITSVIVF